MTFFRTMRIVLTGLAAGVCLGLVLQAYFPAVSGSGEHALVPVVVAAIDLQPGTVLRPEALRVIQWPRAEVPPHTLATLNKASGRVLTVPVVKGEPILRPKLAPAGMREPKPVA